MAARKKAGTTSPSAKEIQSPPNTVAGRDGRNGAQSASVSNKRDVTTTNASNQMTEASENILSYSEDISTAEAPPPLPDGEYLAEIRNATTKPFSSGATGVPVTIVIEPEQFPADYPVEFNPDGVTITSNRLTHEDSPRGRFRMRKFCESIGAPTGKHVNPTDWIGMKVLVTLGHEEWEGIARNNIQKFSPLD